jgi:hypothetical protein
MGLVDVMAPVQRPEVALGCRAAVLGGDGVVGQWPGLLGNHPAPCSSRSEQQRARRGRLAAARLVRRQTPPGSGHCRGRCATQPTRRTRRRGPRGSDRPGRVRRSQRKSAAAPTRPSPVTAVPPLEHWPAPSRRSRRPNRPSTGTPGSVSRSAGGSSAAALASASANSVSRAATSSPCGRAASSSARTRITVSAVSNMRSILLTTDNRAGKPQVSVNPIEAAVGSTSGHRGTSSSSP